MVPLPAHVNFQNSSYLLISTPDTPPLSQQGNEPWAGRRIQIDRNLEARQATITEHKMNSESPGRAENDTGPVQTKTTQPKTKNATEATGCPDLPELETQMQPRTFFRKLHNFRVKSQAKKMKK